MRETSSAESAINHTNAMITAAPRKKINILYIIDELKGGAGTERHLVQLATRLNRDEYQTTVCCFDGGENALEQALAEQGIQLINLDLHKIYSMQAVQKARELSKIIQTRNVDIVQTYHFKSDTFGVIVAKLSGVKKIISSRRDTGELKTPRQLMLNKAINRYINSFIMVCNEVGRKSWESESIPFEKMETIYNGVDLNRFRMVESSFNTELARKYNIEQGDFVVGTVAMFRPEKAYNIFFQAIERIQGKVDRLKVLAIGMGPESEHYKKYCNAGPLKNIVHFPGYIEDTERHLPLMDIFCLVPNKREGFSNALIEAMAMSRPVIATDVGGNAEAVVDGETGIIIPPDDPEKLADALLHLHRNPFLRKQFGKNSRRRVEQMFTVEKMIEHHEIFYRRLIV